MPRLIWTPRSLRDLARLRAFIKDKSQAAAKRAIQAIRHGVILLETHPQAGRPVEDMDPEFREWPIPFGDGAYVVRYRIAGNVVVLLTVRHGRELGA